MLYFHHDETGFPIEASTRSSPDATTRHDLKTFEDAKRLALSFTVSLFELFVATDEGPYVHPRYDVVRLPKIGEPVSRYFNGDSYPAGTITKISKSLRRIQTSDGTVFFRRRLTGSWVQDGTWSMIPGHHNLRNPHL